MVGALVVTHGDVAKELVNAAHRITGENELLLAVCIAWDEDVATARRKIAEAIPLVDRGAGVLILTDMFGGTASNLSLTLMAPERVEVVTGVNLSMLLKLRSAACEKLTLPELAEAVCGRGREAIQIPSRALKARPKDGGEVPVGGKEGGR